MTLPDLAPIFRRESADSSVLVADGMNITITVRNGQLRVSDGIRSQRRDRAISRAPKSVSRLVILGTTGYITLEAFRWLSDEGIAISQLDNHGRIIMNAPGKSSDLTIMRSQLIAAGQGTESPLSIAIAKRLISAKLTGQADIARTMLDNPEIANRIDTLCNSVNASTTLGAIMGFEGVAAKLYWSCWQSVSVPFSPTDMAKVPPRWLSWQGRKAEQGSTDPINSMLNYAYRIAESEALHACNINGIDPTISLMHANHSDRNNMALDFMECIRPMCDRIVLNLLDYGKGIPFDGRGKPKYFPAKWCDELTHGVTRLFAPLTHALAEHSIVLAESLAPVIADIAKLLRTADLTASIPVGHANGSHAVPTGVTHVRRYAPPRKPGRALRDTSMPVPSCAADVVPDEAWRLISRHIPAKIDRRGGARRLDDRVVIAALVWTAANNLPLTRCPESLDVSGHTLYQRKKRWQESGAWQHIEHAIRRTVLPGYRGN